MPENESKIASVQPSQAAPCGSSSAIVCSAIPLDKVFWNDWKTPPESGRKIRAIVRDLGSLKEITSIWHGDHFSNYWTACVPCAWRYLDDAESCKHKEPPVLGYVDYHLDAENRMKAGQRQKHCDVCRRWIWEEYWQNDKAETSERSE
jgi:hypothetical protein